MPRRKHGEKSKFWHIRIRKPDSLNEMRTVVRGPIKQVMGKSKKTGKWVEQNIMIKKSQAKQAGSRLIIKSKKVRDELKRKGISLSNIVKSKTGGDADYDFKKKNKRGKKK